MCVVVFDCGNFCCGKYCVIVCLLRGGCNCGLIGALVRLGVMCVRNGFGLSGLYLFLGLSLLVKLHGEVDFADT